MRINLSEYEGQPLPDDPQKQIIYRLVMQLHYYIKAPIHEFNAALPQLKVLEQKCQDFDDMEGKPKINYIMEIIALLHEEEKNRQVRSNLKDDEASLFWKTIMAVREKIIKIKKL